MDSLKALDPKRPIREADIHQREWHVRFVPIADIAAYSITSSARASSDGGTSRPSALAVLRLSTSLVLGRRLHRQVGRLLALEDAVDVAGRAPVLVDVIRPIGDQAAGGDEGAFEVDRGQLVPGRQRDDQIAMNAPPTRSAVTIRPPFGERAKAATARSISPASRMLTGLTSTLSDGATAWMTPNWLVPVALGGIPKDRRPRHARRDLLEQLQPFPAHAVFERHETGGVAARPRQAVDEAGGDRIGDDREHDRHGAGRLQQRPHGRGAMGQDDVRRERGQFRRVSANFGGIGRGPAGVDPHVAADGPAQ